jgi:quercetin dioxygenase-like cupin family protein
MGKNDIDPLTEEETASWPKDPLVPLEKPFVDARGAIQPLVDEMMKSAVMIESKKGSLRANHYHKTDWHYCYVVAGTIEYYHRPTGSTEDPECLIVKTGEMVFTPPMVDHGMKFPEDTRFLTLSRNPRDQKSYEADVVRVDMLDTDGLKSWKPGDEDE